MNTLRLIGNRSLHWIAAIGVFLMCDAIGVQQVAADYMRSISWNISQGK